MSGLTLSLAEDSPRFSTRPLALAFLPAVPFVLANMFSTRLAEFPEQIGRRVSPLFLDDCSFFKCFLPIWCFRLQMVANLNKYTFEH